MTVVRAIGLMSGTSMDGIDVALVETDGDAFVKRGPSLMVPYAPGFRRRLETVLEEAKAIRAREERPGDLDVVERDLTDQHADAVCAFLKQQQLSQAEIGVVGFHGQTVLHRPERQLTVQIGDGPRLAKSLGLPVVYDMRANDMIHGGQGAPLVPAYHRALAANLPDDLRSIGSVVFVNIGGISNATYLDAGQPPVAFDCGPGNALIDQWVQAGAGIPYDDRGAVASEGSVDEAVVTRYLAHPFFELAGPKSLDRNDFTLDEVEGLDLADGAATLAKVTAEGILRAGVLLPKPPAVWIICGGGARNPAIIACLKEGAETARVVTADEAGFDGDAMEAEAWAYLAVRALNKQPLTWPTTTGCDAPVSGGVIARPDDKPDGG